MSISIEALRSLISAIAKLQRAIVNSQAPAWVREDLLTEQDFRRAKVTQPSLKKAIRSRVNEPLAMAFQIKSATQTDIASWAVARQCIAAHLSELWYVRDFEDGRKTEKLHGWLMYSPAEYSLAVAVNTAKRTFQLAVASLKQGSEASWVELEEKNRRTANRWRQDLGSIGNGRLCLRQAYRKIPIISDPVQKIGYSYSAHSKSIRTIEHGSALEALDSFARKSDHVLQQIDLVKSMSDSTRLVQVQNTTPYYKANILCLSEDEKKIRVTVKCGMPFFIPIADKTPDFTRKIPSDEAHPPRARLLRTDIRVKSEPVLPSIRGYVSGDAR